MPGPLGRRENAHHVADVHGNRVIFMSCPRPPISGQSCHRVIAGLGHPDGIVAFGNETCDDALDAQVIACVCSADQFTQVRPQVVEIVFAEVRHRGGF